MMKIKFKYIVLSCKLRTAGGYREFGLDAAGNLYAHYISEAYAYKWSAPYVEKYGLGDRIYGFDAYEKYLNLLPANYIFPK
jgi:hypothetical protein